MARRLEPALENAAPDALALALGAEARARLEAMLDGIERYRVHPYRRRIDEPPEIWREGASRLLDFGAFGSEAASGPPVLFVPSLVNRGYVLDLSERRSLLRELARRGLRPFLLEWGAPGPDERGFSFTDYVAGRLERALDAVHAQTGGPISLVGYCMGGQLALALALRRPAEIGRLALLATPWDYHAGQRAVIENLAWLAGPLDFVIEQTGELPVEWIQTLLAGLDPSLVPNKFRAFAALDPASPAAANFVALEDWINDGIALTGPVAREFLFGWYVENQAARGEWRVAGRPVEPGALACPALLIIPRRDRIVPPEGAAALGAAIPGAEVISVDLGHIGMVVSARARAQVWDPLATWLGVSAQPAPVRRGTRKAAARQAGTTRKTAGRRRRGKS